MDFINVNHHGVEFGYELGAVIPYAYWLHQNGMLGVTHSCRDTQCLYYFNDKHVENIGRRHSHRLRMCLSEGLIPNIKLHLYEFDYSKWSPPPYKDYYKNDAYNFDVVVTNKFNKEWGGAPINYYSIETLDEIFDSLKDYNVLYNRLTNNMGYDDTVDSLEIGEWGVVNNHRNVTRVQDVVGGDNYNTSQLKAYANAKLFVTVQGGSSILASYFGGTNIIYAVKGQELRFGEYDHWYPMLSGSSIVHRTEHTDILKEIEIWKESMTL